MTRRIAAATGGLLAAFALGAMPTVSRAQDSGVIYAGGSVGDGANAYAGGVVALPGAHLGDGFAIRGGTSGGQYRYESGGRRISADYLGGEVALVYQTSGGWGWANFSGGGRVTDTRLKPGDPGNRLAGTRFDLALQSDGAVGNAWRATWFASLGVNDRAYITQVRVGRLVHGVSDTRLGIEGGIQGDRSYTRTSAGAFVSTRVTGQWIGQLSGGFTKQKDRQAEPYVAIGVSKIF